MDQPGNCFVYGEHVKGSGLYVLAACLEAQGFKRYSDTSPVVDMTTGAIKEPLALTNLKRYPYDAEFQKKISAKREFAMLHSVPGENIKQGDLYNHQKFVRQFLTQYDRLFLISEPGTGKTCSVVSFCEYVVRLKHYGIPNSLSRIKRFVIVVRSTFHIENIKNMIDKVCSGKFYSRSSDRRMFPGCSKRPRMEKGAACGGGRVNEDKVRRAAYRKMSKVGYEVVTYWGLAKILKQKYLDTSPPNLSALRKRFSDSLVWLDEAHNVALSPSQLITRKSHVKEETYWALHALFHRVTGMKVVISTATPMLNDAGEMISLVNLLRTEDGAPPADWNWRMTDDETFAFRFPEATRSGLDRKTCVSRDLDGLFVGQMNPRKDIGSMTDEHHEQHFRGLFVYSRQDPVGVSVKFEGTPGKVDMSDEVSKRSLPGKRQGRMKLYKSTMPPSRAPSSSRSGGEQLLLPAVEERQQLCIPGG